MPTQFSLPLLAALLLGNLVIAQAIGLRSPRNLHEAIGLGASSALVLLVSIACYWPIAHLLLPPFDLTFLALPLALLIIATAATMIEANLHAKYPAYFPVQDNLLPQIVVSTLILALPLLQNLTLSFIDGLARAALEGIGASILIALFHALREHAAATDIPQPFRGAAGDLISAGLVVAALSGFVGIL